MPDRLTIIKEATANKKISCPSCGGEMIQKIKARLIVVGLGMIASVAIAFVFPLFWAPSIILALTGIYLLTWATIGQARWCETAKHSEQRQRNKRHGNDNNSNSFFSFRCRLFPCLNP